MGVDLFFHKDEGVAEDFEFFQIMLIDKPVTVLTNYQLLHTLWWMGGVNGEYPIQNAEVVEAAKRIEINSYVGYNWLMNIAHDDSSLIISEDRDNEPNTLHAPSIHTDMYVTGYVAMYDQYTISVHDGNQYVAKEGSLIELNHIDGQEGINANHWVPILQLLGRMNAEGAEYDSRDLEKHAEVFLTNGLLLGGYLENHASMGRSMSNDYMDAPERFCPNR